MNGLASEPGIAVEPILALSASYRHAIMNHLQVLSGWLQLGYPQRAAEHIHLLEEGLLEETRLVRSARPEVAAVLLLRRGVGELCGIEVAYRAPEGIRDFGWPEGFPVEALVSAIDGAILSLNDAARGRRLDLVLEEDDVSRTLALRLVEADVSGLGGQEALERIEAWGGAWECAQEGAVGVVRISWPKAGLP